MDSLYILFAGINADTYAGVDVTASSAGHTIGNSEVDVNVVYL
ncbi:MAG: hypothetical protein V5A64_05285 [Candidatus Thermoplasmatota archaeon]